MKRGLAVGAVLASAVWAAPAHADQGHGVTIHLRLTFGGPIATDSALPLDVADVTELPLPAVPEPDASPHAGFGPGGPNPFIEATRLAFTLPEASETRLAIYDMRGRLVRVLVEGLLPKGEHEREWDARDAAGVRVARGAYVAVLRTPFGSAARRLLVTR